MQYYISVCRFFGTDREKRYAVGPFDDRDSAVRVCARLNKETELVGFVCRLTSMRDFNRDMLMERLINQAFVE